MLAAEATEGVHTATQALLWLLRGLQFTMIALQYNQGDSAQELSVSFSKAYEGTLKKYHNFVVKGVFAVSTSYLSILRIYSERRAPTGNCSHTHCLVYKLMNESLVLTHSTDCVEGLSVSKRLLRKARLAAGEGSG